MYFCKNCGKQIDDDAKFCPYCGTKQSDDLEESNKEENSNEYAEQLNNANFSQIHGEEVKPKVTFSEAVPLLLKNLFNFKGRTTRREFNFGVLFFIIVSIALSTINSFVSFSTLIIQAENGQISIQIPSDPLALFNILRYVSGFVTIVLLLAISYRRSYDLSGSKSFSILGPIAIIVYAVCGTNVFSLLTKSEALQGLESLLQLAALAYIIVMMCKTSAFHYDDKGNKIE